MEYEGVSVTEDLTLTHRETLQQKREKAKSKNNFIRCVQGIRKQMGAEEVHEAETCSVSSVEQPSTGNQVSIDDMAIDNRQ